MLKRLLTISLTVLLTVSQVEAATMQEAQKVFKEGQHICSIYRQQCIIKPVRDKKLLAQTKPYGYIDVSTYLIDKLTIEQLRGVVYHEVGHRVMQHVEKTAEYLYTSKYNGTFDKEYFSEFRKKNELQADKFAVYIGMFTFKSIDLVGALIAITPREDFYIEGETHPSTADRIENIRRLYYGQIK